MSKGKTEELFRMATSTEGMDVVIEREGEETWLVLDHWGNGTREGAVIGPSDCQQLARALNREMRERLAPKPA